MPYKRSSLLSLGPCHQGDTHYLEPTTGAAQLLYLYSTGLKINSRQNLVWQTGRLLPQQRLPPVVTGVIRLEQPMRDCTIATYCNNQPKLSMH